MIKDIFNRDHFTYSGFDAKAKKQSLVVTIAMIVVFIIAALCTFNFFYVICDVIGSIVSGSPDCAIRDLVRSLPILLTLLGLVHIFVSLHYTHRNVSDEKRTKGISYNSIASIVFGGATILYVIVGAIAGVYSSLVTGYPSILYPLDALLGGLLIVAIGVLSLLWNKKFQSKFPYLVPNRANTAKGVEKLFHHFFVGIWTLVALYGLSAVINSTYIVDWTHGHVFYSVMLVLMFALPVFYLMIWEFYYNELKEENRNDMLLVSISGIALSVVIVGLYALAYNLDPQAPDLACFGILPVDYTASVNAGTYIYGIANLVIPVTALIKALIANKKK